MIEKHTSLTGNPASAVVFALSGLGKTYLCSKFPTVAYDTDRAFERALDNAWPGLGERAAKRRWRQLAQGQPWQRPASDAFQLWAHTRRQFMGEIVAQLRRPTPVLVFTSFSFIPWRYLAYYGLQLDRYAEHWRLLEREADNDQSEPRNARLEGFSPLIRLLPGEFLSDQADLIERLEAFQALCLEESSC